MQLERAQLEEARVARVASNELLRAQRDEQRRQTPAPALTAEQAALAKKKRRQQRREAKGRPLAELPVRKAVVELKVEGWRTHEIAKHLSIPESAVGRHLKAWQLAESPSEETSAQLRGIMLERLESMHRKEWKKYANGDEKAGELLLKVMDRASRLMGTDLQPSSVTLAISAESIARFLGWDPDPLAAPPPPLELPPGSVAELTEPDDVEDGGGADA